MFGVNASHTRTFERDDEIRTRLGLTPALHGPTRMDQDAGIEDDNAHAGWKHRALVLAACVVTGLWPMPAPPCNLPTTTTTTTTTATASPTTATGIHVIVGRRCDGALQFLDLVAQEGSTQRARHGQPRGRSRSGSWRRAARRRHSTSPCFRENYSFSLGVALGFVVGQYVGRRVTRPGVSGSTVFIPTSFKETPPFSRR
jgi:hypothetical protein